jgi:hypothetical protein
MRILISSILLLIVNYVPARGAQVIWGDTTYSIDDLQGTPLVSGDLVEVGTFSLNPAQIAADSNNVGFLQSAWLAYGTGQIGDGPEPAGFWFDDTVAPDTSIEGAPIY